MAKVVSTAYVDDLDGSEASGPVDFSLDGKDYTIDLSDSNAARLRDALAVFVASARRASGSGRRQSSSPQRSASGGRARRHRRFGPFFVSWVTR